MTCPNPAQAARALQAAGLWDEALSLLQPGEGENAGIAASIAVDRFFFCLREEEPAIEAVRKLEKSGSDPVLADLLHAQVAYTRFLFDHGPRSDDGPTAIRLVEAAIRDENSEHHGWALFWRGVMNENLNKAKDLAQDMYGHALSVGTAKDDQLLRSYALRHIGFQRIAADRTAAEAMLRESLYIRSALGRRPLVAASQASLAQLLGNTTEAGMLIRNAKRTASELGIRWLQAALSRAN